MRILEIINEDQADPSKYEKLNTFRKSKSGPDQLPPKDFGNDKVALPKPPADSSRRSKASGSPEKMTPRNDSEEEKTQISRIHSVFNVAKKQADKLGRMLGFAPYNDGTFAIYSNTNNGLKIIIGPESGPYGRLAYHIENVPKDGDAYEVINSLLVGLGYPKSKFGKTKLRFLPKKENLENLVAGYWDIVEQIENLGPDFKPNGGSGRGAGSKIKREQTPIRYYWKLAGNLYDSIKAGADWAVSRGGEGSGFDVADKQIIIGITKGGIEQQQKGREAYREHAVPCDLINEMGIQLVYDHPKWKTTEKAEVIRKLMDLIQRNLAIVLCSSPAKDSDKKSVRDSKNPTDQEIVDQKFRTTMPPGWKDGDSILARFEYYNIPVYKYKSGGSDNGNRIAEDD